jgi:hypothetical protein
MSPRRVASSVATSQFGIFSRQSENAATLASIAARTSLSAFARGSIVVVGAWVEVAVVATVVAIDVSDVEVDTDDGSGELVVVTVAGSVVTAEPPPLHAASQQIAVTPAATKPMDRRHRLRRTAVTMRSADPTPPTVP